MFKSGAWEDNVQVYVNNKKVVEINGQWKAARRVECKGLAMSELEAYRGKVDQ